MRAAAVVGPRKERAQQVPMLRTATPVVVKMEIKYVVIVVVVVMVAVVIHTGQIIVLHSFSAVIHTYLTVCDM